MIFAMILMTAGVFVLAAVLQTAATQGISGETEWLAVDRRVTLGNSRAMAREYLLSRLFRVPQNTNNWPATFSNSAGAFSVQPAGALQESYWDARSLVISNVVLNINPFNLMERGGFYREVFQANLDNGARSVDWSFALRTRSPVAAGYSFTQQRPAANDLASMASPPYIDMGGSGDQFFGFYGLPRMPLASVTNLMTRGAGDTNGYQGYLDVPDGTGAGNPAPFTGVSFVPRNMTTNSNNPTSVLEVRLDLNDGGGNVFADAFRYDVPAMAQIDKDGDGLPDDDDANGQIDDTSFYPVETVVLEGSDVSTMTPLHVVVPAANTNVKSLLLADDNERRVYFYRAKAANDGVPFDVASVDANVWRLGITMSQCNIQFDLGDLEVTGGLRTDGNITFQAGSATFLPEVDPGGLDFIADRMMWLEDYRAQQ